MCARGHRKERKLLSGDDTLTLSFPYLKKGDIEGRAHMGGSHSYGPTLGAQAGPAATEGWTRRRGGGARRQRFC